MYLAKQFLQLRTIGTLWRLGYQKIKQGASQYFYQQSSLLIDHFLLTPCEIRRWP